VLVAAGFLDLICAGATAAAFTLPNELLNRIGTISLGFGCSDPAPPAGLLLPARFGGILLLGLPVNSYMYIGSLNSKNRDLTPWHASPRL